MSNIAFIVLVKNSFNKKETGVWGDELVANAMVRGLRILGEEARVLQFDEDIRCDIAIWMSDVIPKEFMKHKKNYLWIQGFKYDGFSNIIPLDTYYDSKKDKYDKVFTASRKLANDKNIPFITPCVDFDYFHKVPQDRYKYEITFIGNIIKPGPVLYRYLSPMQDFKYGLFGGDFGKISHLQSLSVMAGSDINLHFGFEEAIEWDMVTGRPFHISACEQFTLSDKLPYFTEVYKDAIAFTDGGDDEKCVIAEYLKQPEKRKEMAKKAYEVTKENFECTKVAKKLLEVL